MPNLLVILSLISFLSIIILIGYPLKSYTNFYENNNHILLKLTPIYAQDNSGNFEDGDIFPDFKTEDKGGKDGDIFPDFKTEDTGGKEKDGDGDGGKEKDGDGDGGKEKDGDGDGGKEKDGGNEGRINKNTNDFSPLASGSPTNTDDKVNPYGSPTNTDDKVNPYGSPTNTDDKVNPYGSPTNTDDKVNPYNEVRQQVGQQLEQEAEDSVQ
jgi:hypothetical protein